MAEKLTLERIEDIRHLYQDLGYSSIQIADKLRVGRRTVITYMTRMGINRNLSESRKLAIKQGRLKVGSKPGKDSLKWKGGKTISSRGYIKIYVFPNDALHVMADRDHYVMEHRLVMARHLNRPLTSDEFIHHLNGIKTDNRFKNLALTSRFNHPSKTLMKLIQARIRDLEAELAQQRLV